jgi:IS4 transposase
VIYPESVYYGVKRDWAAVLYDIWKENRGMPGWADIYELHNETDRAFFMLLDKTGGYHQVKKMK